MLSPGDPNSISNGTPGLLSAALTAYVPMIVLMVRRRASIKKLLLSPIVVPPLLIAAAICISIVSWVLGLTDGGWLQLVIGFLILGGLGCACGLYFSRAALPHETLHQRGAVVLRGGAEAKARKSVDLPREPNAPCDPNVPITLAGISMAAGDETKHFKFIGTTGTGKSTAIREMLSTALARGDRAVIADPDGGYLRNFYNASRGDVILNPFDPDSVKWSLLGEIKNDYDVDQLVRSLIPDHAESDTTWTEYARTYFTAVIQQMIKAQITDESEINRLVTRGSTRELRILLEGTSAGPLVENGSEKMLGSVRSITSSACAALKYTSRVAGKPFSVREWVREGKSRHEGGRGGVLFIPYKAGEIAALRSVISAWMRIAIFEAMDRSEGDQRLWFVVDELDALGAIDGLKDALARLRKFGGRCVLGFQSIAQVSGTYGKGMADTIVENCGNTLLLRCSASEKGGTSQFASQLIGQRQVIHLTQSKSRKDSDWMGADGSTTSGEHLSIEPVVMASEIERLADLEGYLKFASTPDWRLVRLRPVRYPEVLWNSGRDRVSDVKVPAAMGTPGTTAAQSDVTARHVMPATKAAVTGVAGARDVGLGETEIVAKTPRSAKPRAPRVARTGKNRTEAAAATLPQGSLQLSSFDDGVGDPVSEGPAGTVGGPVVPAVMIAPPGGDEHRGES